MLLDYIQYKKTHITASEIGASSMSGLDTVHTVKIPPAAYWSVDATPASAWLKVNLYERSPIDRIDIDYTGTIADLTIEGSHDNFNWETITATYTPTSTELVIDYTDSTHYYTFVKITVSSPVGFQIDDLEIFGNVDFENEDFISQAIHLLYPQRYRDEYPHIPSIMSSALEMMEAQSDIDLKLFDSSDYANTSITKSTYSTAWVANTAYALKDRIYEDSSLWECTVAGTSHASTEPTWSGQPDAGDTISDGTVTWTRLAFQNVILTPTSIPTISGAQYIWDFDDVIYNWVAATAYPLGFVIFEDGFVWEATTAGTSHASTEPTWSSIAIGGTVVDGTVTWTKKAAKYMSDNNPRRIVTTTAPVSAVSYDYRGNTGVYAPRLIIKTNDYQLEWTAQYIKT